MHSTSQVLVHALLASVLHRASASIRDADVLDELGANAQALIFVTSKLEELQPENGEFPIVALAYARTVGDLVELVESWSRRGGAADPMDGMGLRGPARVRGIG
jgi:hypothetical protein